MQGPDFSHRALPVDELSLLNESEQGAAKRAALPDRPQYTGRYFAVLRQKPSAGSLNRLFEHQAGLRLASTSDFPGSVTEVERADIDALYYERLGVVLLAGQSGQARLLAEATNQVILQPERIFYVPGAAGEPLPEPLVIPATWGLTATGAAASALTGKGVRVAVLDTGFDAGHADFAGRHLVSKSFVPGEPTTQDYHGHGTHCIGTACGRHHGPRTRYGVAGESEIYVGKIFGRGGASAGGWLLDAIDWAVANQCRVISLSLGAPVLPHQGIDRYYELAGQDALAHNCIIVAAAGNDSSRRDDVIAPVSSPANCASILAVAAVDAQYGVADFSGAAINPHQLIDIAAPGVGVYSSWVSAPDQPAYRTISGTSMATPHVAGVLALLWEKFPNFTAAEIVAELRRLARPLPHLLTSDVGAGLVQAP